MNISVKEVKNANGDVFAYDILNDRRIIATVTTKEEAERIVYILNKLKEEAS